MVEGYKEVALRSKDGGIQGVTTEGGGGIKNKADSKEPAFYSPKKKSS